MIKNTDKATKVKFNETLLLWILIKENIGWCHIYILKEIVPKKTIILLDNIFLRIELLLVKIISKKIPIHG